MLIKVDSVGDQFLGAELKVLTAVQKSATTPTAKAAKTKTAAPASSASIDHWSDKGLKEEFHNLKIAKNYKAGKDERTRSALIASIKVNSESTNL